MAASGVYNEYVRALRLGQKEQRERLEAKQDPYPAVLEEVLPDMGHYPVQELPAQDVPAGRIVGTKSAGRVSAFSASFYPLLEPESEFAAKWMALCEAHLSDTGIREPIVCYEYLGSFYVQEGNKRLSVLKYFGAAKIPCVIKRVLPGAGDEPEIRAYSEFLAFHRSSGLYDIQFRKPGDYAKLLAYLGKCPDDVWTEQERRAFSSRYYYFLEAFESLGGKERDLLPEEALLLWLRVHPFSQLAELPPKDLKKTLSDLWGDVLTDAGQTPVQVRTVPEDAAKSVLGKLIPPSPAHLNVALIHQQDAEISTWTRGHEQGAAELREALGDRVTVRSYFHADTPEQAEALLELAVEDGAELVFTTTPTLLRPTLKVAVKYPKVRFLNCSVDTPLSSVRSYYCRTFEGKFITGVIAGALAENNEIGYVGSYPIMGVPASINAFALGARMSNPRAKILLEWSCLPGDAARTLLDRGIRVISNRDIPLQNRQYLAHGEYGTYIVDGSGTLVPLASPCWLWGNMYEQIVRSVLSGNWPQKKGSPEAVNYWWGMDAGAIDVELTDLVPEGVRTLAVLLAREIREGRLDPFLREIRAQDGTLKNSGETGFTPEELLHMDWLCDNVVGHIPAYEELLPVSQTLVRELGIHRDSIPPEKEDAPSPM